MNRTVKTFIVWLLMALLPLHALAAGIGMSCAPVRQQVVQDENAGAMQHHLSSDAHAHHGSEHASDASKVALDGTSSDTGLAKQAHSACSACSSFCGGAVAPPSAFLPFPTFGGSDAVLPVPTTFVAGFIPDGLQRPPRHQSA